MTLLFLDTETFSDVPLSQGLARYTASKALLVLLVAYAIDTGPVHLWDTRELLPVSLFDALIDDTTRIVAHNALFDQRVLRMTQVLGRRINIDLSRWLCTEAQALSHSLPGGLADLCDALGVPSGYGKINGKKLINLFCVPHTGQRVLPDDARQEWADFCWYAKRDVEAMRACFHRMPRWNYPGKDWPAQPGTEFHHWLRQSAINERGMAVDLNFAHRAIALSESNKQLLNNQTARLTGGVVRAATQRDALLDYLKVHFGVVLPDLTKTTVAAALRRKDLNPQVRELLQVRQESAQNTAAKYTAVVGATSPDGRLRHALRFCGAPTTGRLTGRIFQPQNLKRPSLKPAEQEAAIDTITAGGMPRGDIATLLGDCIRGVVRCAAGHKLVASDLSAIEARVLAWLAGDAPVIQFYTDFDAGRVSYDNYVSAYAQAFDIDPSLVDDAMRRIGKAMVLGLGFGGGAGAFATFVATVGIIMEDLIAAVKGVAHPDDWNAALDKHEWAKSKGYHGGLGKDAYAACEYLKTQWRNSRQPTVAFWNKLESAVRNAVNVEGMVFYAGKHIAVRREGRWTRIRLPSGRCLTVMDVRDTSSGLVCRSYDEDLHTMIDDMPLYGGKLAGWVTQATARDIITYALPRISDAGFPIVLTVHDEVVTEPKQSSGLTLQLLNNLLAAGESWTHGLPMAANGWEGMRYRK